MKTKAYFLASLVMIFYVNASAVKFDGQTITGESGTALGNYSIAKSEVSMVIDDQALVTYEVSYEKATSPVLIAVKKETECTRYLVLSGEVEVQYVWQNNSFGVRKMNKKFRQFDSAKSESSIDRARYLSQQVITQNPKSNDELLGLIACYFPMLVDQQYLSRM